MMTCALLAGTLVLLAPVGVFAQAASPAETRLEMERRQQRSIVRPMPPPEAVERDASAAASEVEAQRRREETLRRTTQPTRRRPDLDYDVKSGIQSQRLNDALRSR